VAFLVHVTVITVLPAAIFWLGRISIGEKPTASVFGMFTLQVICCLVNLTIVKLSKLISACVSTVERAIAVYMLLLVYSLLLGGFIVGPKSLPAAAKPLLYTSFYYWGFEALCVNEFGGTADGEQTLVDLGFVGVAVWHNVLILAGFVLVLRTLAFVALWRTRY
jgi:hypothetical protein